MRWIAGLIMIFLGYGMPAHAAAQSSSPPDSPVAADGIDPPSGKGRLRFKSRGPVCMCGDGLSERDIERAMVRQGLAKAQADTGMPRVEGGRSAMDKQTPSGGVAQ